MVRIVINHGTQEGAPASNSVPPTSHPQAPNNSASGNQNGPIDESGETSLTTTTTTSTTTTSEESSSDPSSSTSRTTSDPSSSSSGTTSGNTSTNATSASSSSYSSSYSLSTKKRNHKHSQESSQPSTTSSQTISNDASTSYSVNSEALLNLGEENVPAEDEGVSDASLKGSRAVKSNNVTQGRDRSTDVALSPTEYCHLSAKNKKIILTNIRHFRVLFWILLFAQETLQLGYVSIIGRVLSVENSLISVYTIKPFLIPCVIITVTFSMVHIILSHYTVVKMRSKRIHRVYLVSLSLVLLLDIIMLITTGTELCMILDNLGGDMMTLLNRSLSLGVTSKELHIIQIWRSCCGVYGPKDWLPTGGRKDVPKLPGNTSHSTTGLSYYPFSCCPKHEISFDDNWGSACPINKLWKVGCHEKEADWISLYCGWYMTLLGIGLVLNVLTAIQINRIYKYCQTYCPHWVHSGETSSIKSDKKPQESGDL